MNPFKRLQHYFIGDILAQTDDVFEKVKAEVLFNFTVFFFVTNIPYSIMAWSLSWIHSVVGAASLPALVCVLIILKKTKNITWAIYFYLINHTMQNFWHYFANNGQIEGQGILFFVLYVMFGFLLLGRKWGVGLTIVIICTYFIGTYNQLSGLSLFQIPPEYADPQEIPIMHYFTVIPVLLNIYLVSEFVNARSKAEIQIRDQKIKLESSHKELESKNKDITDSINYAQKIQRAVLPNEETISRNIPLAFILFKPRDIVSGDFFWFHEIDRDNYIIVCADCTGHGVPGAMMTVIGSNLLNQVVIDNKITQPSQILLVLDNFINQTLKQQKEFEYTVQDGMDLALLKVDKANKEFTFTSAKRPAIFFRDKQIQEFKGSKNSLGGMITGCKVFQETKMNYREDDILYLYTDGYTDQFGGPKGKKFSSRQLKDTLLNIHRLPIPEQKLKLESTIDNWKRNLEQVDDILIMGIRF